ncbi:MAG: glycosyltransferase [Chitinophagaceae bacterium]|nr:glycosyltransferase [Chitinophagaceae bacterium]
MNKKVLYISYDGMTDPLGQSQVLPYLAGLSRQGYEFTLVSFEKKKRFEVSGQIIQSLCDKHAIKWVPLFFSSRPPVLSKLYDQWKMKRMVLKLQQKQHFDFTHCRSYVAAAAGLKLFKKYQVPFLFDMRGFWVDERVDNGQWNLKKPIYRFFYKLYKQKEKNYFREAKHIISLTERGKEELIAAYAIPAGKISVIPCCADLEHFDYHKVDLQEMEALKSKLGVNATDKVISYLGSLGGWYLTDEMLDFFKVLKAAVPKARFLFITHDAKELIIRKAVQKNIQPADIIVQPASRKEVPLLLSLSNWSIFFIKDAYSKKASSPTKQGEIMAMGIPILCNDIGDTGRIVKESGVGIIIHDYTYKSYKLILEQLEKLNRLDKKMIRRSAFDYYDLNKGIASYEQVYNKILD